MSDKPEAKSLWGDLSWTKTMPRLIGTTPYKLLTEQGDLLAHLTEGHMAGKVEIYDKANQLRFYLSVPSLGQFTYHLFTVHFSATYPYRIFPIKIICNVGDWEYFARCEDEEGFEKEIKEILSSPKVHEIIQKIRSLF